MDTQVSQVLPQAGQIVACRIERPTLTVWLVGVATGDSGFDGDVHAFTVNDVVRFTEDLLGSSTTAVESFDHYELTADKLVGFSGDDDTAEDARFYLAQYGRTQERAADRAQQDRRAAQRREDRHEANAEAVNAALVAAYEDDDRAREINEHTTRERFTDERSI